MRTSIVSLASGLLLSSPTWAQMPAPPTRSIAVSGQAEVRVTPSIVNLVLGVETLRRSLPAAKAENDRRVEAVVKSLQGLGVDAKDIQTDYIHVEPDYFTRDDTITILRRYTVRKTVAVTLRDVTKFERVLGGALQSGATHVLNVQFLTDDLRKHARSRQRARRPRRSHMSSTRASGRSSR